MADQQPAIVKTFSLHQGMDNRNAPWVLGEHQADRIENLDAHLAGKRTRRRGVASIGAASGVTTVQSPTGLWPFFNRELGQEVLYGVWDSRIYMLPGNAQVLEKACGVSLTQSLHMASRGLWRTFDAIYINQAQYNDSNVSLASKLVAIGLDNGFSQASAMAPRFSLWWQGRLWCGANALAGDDQTVWWSELLDGLSYSAFNSIRVESGRGGALTGMVPLRAASPRAIVFKERLTAIIETYWGSSSSLIPAAGDALDTVKTNIRTVAENVGCVATKSIQYVPGASVGDIFFLAHDGVRAISRAADDTVSGSSLPVSAAIQSTIERINYTHANKATSAVWDNRYHIAVPLDGATKNNYVLSYDIIGGGWYLNTWDGADLTVARLGQTSERMWMQYGERTTDSVSTGAFTGWHVFRTYTGDVDPGGVPVFTNEQSKAYTFGTLDQRKKWTWFGIHGYNVNATCAIGVRCKIDNDAWEEVGTVVFPEAGGTPVVLGFSPLPWDALPNGVHERRLSLEDFQPGHMIQFELYQSAPSDWSQPTILQTAVAARPLPSEFDNLLT